MNVHCEPVFSDGPDGTVNIAKQLAGHLVQSWCLEKRESFATNGLRTARDPIGGAFSKISFPLIKGETPEVLKPVWL